MESKLLRASPVIPETPMRQVFERTLLFSLAEADAANQASSPAVGDINVNQLAVIDARQAFSLFTVTAPRFFEMRVKSIQVWGPDRFPEIPSTGISVTVNQSNTNEMSGDGATFRDYGTFGQNRSTLRVSPNFSQRAQWCNTGTTSGGEGLLTLVQVRTAALTEFSADQAGSVIVRVVAEMR